MKTQLKMMIPAAIVLLLTISSCSKDRLNDEPDKSTEYSSLDDFYDMNEPEEQEFVIDSIDGDTITAMEGTKIWGIPKEIFMKKSDHSDITYPYTLKVTECYSIKNKILSRYQGKAQGNMLYSSGNLRFRAFKNSDELELKEHCGLPFMAPSSAPDSQMDMYYGFTTGTADDWNNNVLQAGYLFSNDDVSELNTCLYGYTAKTAKTGWVNIAHPFSGAAQSSITFEAEGTNTNLIDIYIIFNNLHSHLKVSDMKALNIPDGEPVTVFAIAKSGNQMYYFKENYATGSPIHIALEMTTATESEILTIMDSL